MLTLENIIMFHQLKEEGLSQREIARRTGHDRKTVKKYLELGMVQPGYKPRAPRAGKLTPYEDYLKARLTLYPGLSGQRLLQEIRERGYQGGYSILVDYLRTIRPQKRVAFETRFETPPGHQAQVDFAEFKVSFTSEPGVVHKLHLFLFILGFSRWFWGRFGWDETLPTVMSGHIGAFEALNGVPRTVLYDRMKTAVIDKPVDGKIRYNTSLVGLLNYYQAIPRACRPYRAKTKGKVENLVSYIRKGFFLGREFEDLDDLNRRFTIWCNEVAHQRRHGTTRRIVFEALAEERSHLQALPGQRYDVVLQTTCKVNREGMVTFETNRYSVPDTIRERLVEVHVGYSLLRFYVKGQLLAIHPRLRGRHQERMEPSHRRSPPPGKHHHGVVVTTDGSEVDTRQLAFYGAVGDRLSSGELR